MPRCNYLLLVVSVVEDWLVDAPWFIVDVALVLLDCWFALTPLVTDWLPWPTCTPGLKFAPAFTSVLLTPTFASTPTFGFTLSDEVLLVEDGEDVLLLLDVDGEELLPLVDEGDDAVPLEVEPEVVPETLPELVLPVAPFDWLLVPDVPMRSLPPEIAALPDVVPWVSAFVP